MGVLRNELLAQGRPVSMGPRSENRGYADKAILLAAANGAFQWVHGQRTVVMCVAPLSKADLRSVSMGPRSENRGYGLPRGLAALTLEEFQWVHGQRTVVMKG